MVPCSESRDPGIPSWGSILHFSRLTTVAGWVEVMGVSVYWSGMGFGSAAIGFGCGVMQLRSGRGMEAGMYFSSMERVREVSKYIEDLRAQDDRSCVIMIAARLEFLLRQANRKAAAKASLQEQGQHRAPAVRRLCLVMLPSGSHSSDACGCVGCIGKNTEHGRALR